jgi:hypothetical protein
MKRPAGATSTLESFAVQTTASLLQKELQRIRPKLRLLSGQDIKPESLTSWSLDAIVVMMKQEAP